MNLLPKGNQRIYAECDMFNEYFPMLRLGHYCHPGINLVYLLSCAQVKHEASLTLSLADLRMSRSDHFSLPPY